MEGQEEESLFPVSITSTRQALLSMKQAQYPAVGKVSPKKRRQHL